MELIRSMHATAGIGKMIQDMVFLDSVHARVFNLCMAEADKVMPLLQTFLTPWNVKPADRPFKILDDATHHTDSAQQRRLLDMAYKVLSEEMPELMIATFPCPSQFFATFVASDAYIYNLRVDRNKLPPKRPIGAG